jgi:hypothetical protein
VSRTTRTISVRRAPGVLLSAAVAAGALFALSGCGQAGVAARVDGHDITVEQVQKATASLQAADPTSFGKVTQAQVLDVLLIAPFAERAAQAAGTAVSDDEVRQAVLSQAQQAGTKNVDVNKLDSGALEALRGNVAFSQLDATAQAGLLKSLQSAHITVSPRYGTFDKKSGSIAAPAPNWIQATPTPKATATASPSASG